MATSGADRTTDRSPETDEGAGAGAAGDSADPASRAARGSLASPSSGDRRAAGSAPDTAQGLESGTKRGEGEGLAEQSSAKSDGAPAQQKLPYGTTREDAADGTTRLHHPDGGVQQREADGTNTFTSPGDSTMSVHPGGAIVTSPDITLSATPGGDVEGATPDGHKVTASPEGDLWVESPDDTTRSIGRDGTTSVSGREGLSVLTSPDGSRSTVTQRGPDGTTVAHDSDGTFSVARPDRSQVSFHSDGTVVSNAPDGAIGIRQPDGAISVTTPNGTTLEVEADGTTYLTTPDGTTTETLPDGRVYQRPPGEEGFYRVHLPIDEPGLESGFGLYVGVAGDIAKPIAVGAKEAVLEMVDTAQAFGEFAWSISPARAIWDFDGWLRTVEDVGESISRIVEYASDDPGKFATEIAKAITDWETWKEDPFRAFGHLVPDLISGAVVKKLATAATKIDDIADAGKTMGKFEDSGGLVKGDDGVWRQRQPGPGDDIGDDLPHTDVDEPHRIDELDARTSERRYGPEQIRLPARDKGYWSGGAEGDSDWTPYNPAQYGLEHGQSIPFRDGVPDLGKFAVDTPDGQRGILNVEGLIGGPGDFKKIDTHLARSTHMTKEQVRDWRRDNGLTYHHYAGNEVQIVPLRLHRPLHHSGSASELRAGPKR